MKQRYYISIKTNNLSYLGLRFQSEKINNRNSKKFKLGLKHNVFYCIRLILEIYSHVLNLSPKKKTQKRKLFQPLKEV